MEAYLGFFLHIGKNPSIGLHKKEDPLQVSNGQDTLQMSSVEGRLPRGRLWRDLLVLYIHNISYRPFIDRGPSIVLLQIKNLQRCFICSYIHFEVFSKGRIPMGFVEDSLGIFYRGNNPKSTSRGLLKKGSLLQLSNGQGSSRCLLWSEDYLKAVYKYIHTIFPIVLYRQRTLYVQIKNSTGCLY